MKNILVLTKNFSTYSSGFYHNDIVEAIKLNSNCFIYGPGYPKYDTRDDIYQVLAKCTLPKIDAIICTTSWDDDNSQDNVDPHPSINLSSIVGIPKIYFLNKEYKKLKQRFEYAKKNSFDLILTVHPAYQEWSQATGLNICQFHFGINLERFQNHNLDREIDFVFSGGLHKVHTDERFIVKKKIFKEKYIDRKSNLGLSNLTRKNFFIEELESYNIKWMEWGAKNYKYGSLLPTGKKYVSLLNRSKLVLNTPSAIGIFNTRFLEAMACGAVIMCPNNGNYNGIMKDEVNCVMYDPDLSNFIPKLKKVLTDNEYRAAISKAGMDCVEEHSYSTKIKKLILSL